MLFIDSVDCIDVVDGCWRHFDDRVQMWMTDSATNI